MALVMVEIFQNQDFVMITGSPLVLSAITSDSPAFSENRKQFQGILFP